MILKYLKEKFSSNLWISPEVFLYLKSIGVDYNIHNSLIQLKYNIFSADWTKEIVKYCRGTIIDMETNEYVATPFIKFFNRTEEQCYYKLDNTIKDFDNGSLVQKCDGTCIILYWYKDRWEVSTLGSIHNTSTLDNGKTFSEIFFSLSDLKYDKLNKENTYIFELCCDVNQIVTKYSSDRIYYLGTNDREFKPVSLDISSVSNSILLPKSISYKYSEGDTWEVISKIIDEHFTKDLGINPEGVCGYKDNVPVFKWKLSNYLLLHKTMSGNERYVKRSIVRMTLDGTIDDHYSNLADYQKEISDKARKFIVNLSIELENNYLALLENVSSKKDLAIKTDKIPWPYRSYYLHRYDKKVNAIEWMLSKSVINKVEDYIMDLI